MIVMLLDSTSLLKEFKFKAERCAHEMLNNAANVTKELPSLQISDAHRAEIVQICSDLIGNKHDVISELFEMDELDPIEDKNALIVRVQRIKSWLGECLPVLHTLVQSLELQSTTQPGYRLAFLLVAESATNILHAFIAMSESADLYTIARPD